MNTFLPCSDFQASARALDNLRLGKQRLETIQLVRAITGDRDGWKHHPAKVMWENNLDSLIQYGMVMCTEWKRRGFLDVIYYDLLLMKAEDNPTPPSWLGSHKLHSSHRANLIRKDPSRYRKFGWTEMPAMTYFWPTTAYDWRGKADDCLDTQVVQGDLAN